MWFLITHRLHLISRMLKKSASGVLALLRGSTYRSVRLVSSLAAALLDGHFEHPAWLRDVASHIETRNSFRSQQEFSGSPLNISTGRGFAFAEEFVINACGCSTGSVFYRS